ncbi:MAG: ABC transporter ATP-binding protein [Dethiobacter sp.]|jgi:oligopeptide transport system ATP-binding protein|nr:ABC transporter ATP-binding protein [Dethiobacter sp.]
MMQVADLKVSFYAGRKEYPVIRSVSFEIRQEEILGLVGESGSGKSMTALALMGLLPAGAKAGGKIGFGGKILTPGNESDWSGVRGREIGMVFQEHAACLNPVMKIGRQICESLEVNGIASGTTAIKKTRRLLERFGIEPSKLRFEQYPHQLSGGLRQRVMLALALACEPRLLIADEPTTALDLTIQAQILDLLYETVREKSTSLLLITHDLGVVARMADRVLVMYAGKIVEKGSVVDIFRAPGHPFTKLLLESTPRLDRTLKKGAHILENEQVWENRGCFFAPRCTKRRKICVSTVPELVEIHKSHFVSCFNCKESI